MAMLKGGTGVRVMNEANLQSSAGFLQGDVFDVEKKSDLFFRTGDSQGGSECDECRGCASSRSCRLATAAKIEGVCPGDRSDVHIIVSAEDWHSHPIASDFGSGVGGRLSAIC